MKSVVANFLARFAAGTTVAQILLRPEPGRAHGIIGFSATSDKAAAVVAFFTGNAPIAPTAAANAAATAIVVGTTAAATLAQNDEVVVHNEATGLSEIRTVSSVSGGTVTLGSGVTEAVTTAGTRLYKLVSAGSMKLGNATLERYLSGNFLTVGRLGRPFLVRVDGTSACAINHLAAELVR